MQTNKQSVFRFNLNDIQRMVFEVVRRIHVPLNEDRAQRGYWTYDKCYKEAKKYKSKWDFGKNSPKAYSAARRNGWLNDYTWFEKLTGKWDYDTCYKEAMKYNSRGEFQKNNGRAYEVARKNGWLNDYTWFSPSASAKKWNRETCYAEAKKYKTRTEFCRNSAGAYEVAKENGWLDDYTWFVSKQKPRGYWTREKCYDEAKKCKSKMEFKNSSPSAYYFACKNKWLCDYTWFEDGVIIRAEKRRKWNRETCYEEAKKYKSRSEFGEKSPAAYSAARKNGWLDEYTWFEKGRISEKNIYVVYYYEDKDTNAVYVGLTNNLKRRHRQHCDGILKHGEFKYDIVYKYWHNTLGKEVPEPIVLHKDIYAKDAQEYEKKYVEQFKNEGKLVLNIAKPGSLGAYGKWTREKCYNEALKYKSRTEFSKNNGSAYQVASKNGWLNDYTWFETKQKPNGYWNQETCYEEAKKYSTRKEFQVKNGSAYRVARRNGWLNDYTWLETKIKPSKYWDKYENCYNEAKKYHSKIDFLRNNSAAYQAAKRNGWLDDYTWFNVLRRNWNYNSCYEEAKKYRTRTEFQRKCIGAYTVARKNGWLDDYTWFQKPSRSNQAAFG